MKCYQAKTNQDFKFISSLFCKKNTRYNFTKKISPAQVKKISSSPRRKDFILIADRKKIGWFNIVQSIDLKEAKFGIIIDKPFQNKGYGTEAMKFINKEMKKMRVKKIRIQVFENNKAAIRVYRKSGYVEKDRLIDMEKRLK